MVTLVWFGLDLRLADNPALSNAVARGGAVIPLFILDDADAGEWALGGASHWWLEGSLSALDKSLRKWASALVLRRGPAQRVIDSLIAETGARRRLLEPPLRALGDRPQRAAQGRSEGRRDRGAQLQCVPDCRALGNAAGDGSSLSHIHAVLEGAAGAGGSRDLRPRRKPFRAPRRFPQSEPLSSWRLRPSAPDWAGGLRATWTPGEDAAKARLAAFVESDRQRLRRPTRPARRRGRHRASHRICTSARSARDRSGGR